VNAGVGSHTTVDCLGRLERDVLVHKPNFVVIMLGINDSWIYKDKTESAVPLATYTANLHKMVAAITATGARPILMTPNPVAAPKYPPKHNAVLRTYADAMRAVARADKIPLVDVYGRWAELSIEGRDLNQLMTDSMHPNAQGQALIAQLLVDEFASLLRK
jgi:lysophospholipase L1-like esterase